MGDLEPLQEISFLQNAGVAAQNHHGSSAFCRERHPASRERKYVLVQSSFEVQTGCDLGLWDRYSGGCYGLDHFPVVRGGSAGGGENDWHKEMKHYDQPNLADEDKAPRPVSLSYSF